MSSSFPPLPPPIQDVRALGLAAQPTIFVSASIPDCKDPDQFVDEDRELVRQERLQCTGVIRPDRIRLAVGALTRVALQRGIRIVFGAHPTITPLMLQAASDIDAPPQSILIFQSQAYAAQIPASTLSLSNWTPARLVLTTQQTEPVRLAVPGRRFRHQFPNSLHFMRERMLDVPTVVGAIFIGGMIGVIDEARQVQQRQQQGASMKCYAIGSTGGAAAWLSDPANNPPSPSMHGTLADPGVLQTMASYTVVAKKIMDDLPPWPGRP